jgi:hypothetical protein
MSTVAADSPAGVCPDCGGPSFHYKGDVHAWRCMSCVDADIGLDRSSPPAATTPLVADRPIPLRRRRQRGGRAVRERMTRKEFPA